MPAYATPPVRSRAMRGALRQRRILVVGALPPPWYGGSVVTQTLLGSSLAQRFDLLHLDISDRRGVANIGRLDAGNVRLAVVHGARFAALLLRNRVDAVYLPVAQNALGFMRDALFLIPAVLRGVPLVLHFHSGNYGEFVRTAPAPLRVLIRSLLSRAQRAIVLGAVLEPMLEGVVPRERIAIVPNCVPDVTLPRREQRSGALRVVFIGNLVPGKGYIELIRAVEQLRAEGVDVEAVIAGGVMDEAAYREARESASRLDGRIRFAGPVDEAAKAELLSQADVLALPSYYENEAHPLVILEAMAAGLPVVSTRHVAIPEIVRAGETGILVEPRDVAALAGALRELASDRDMLERMGRAGRARYLIEFTVSRWAERMACVFDEACGGAADA